MAQGLVQQQTQQQTLNQTLSPQQLLQVRLLELPVAELEQRVRTEMDDNPALEESLKCEEDFPVDDQANEEKEKEEDTYAETVEKDERQSALDEALSSIGADDQMPEYIAPHNPSRPEHPEEITYGDTISFYDELKEQIGEHQFDKKQREIAEYLIGSLESDGLLHKSLTTIEDELAIYQNIDTSIDELETILSVIQEFDPPGIGARDLQECLLLQIQRKGNTPLKHIEEKIIKDYFKAFTLKHWNQIKSDLRREEVDINDALNELCKLNPKPGASMGETVGQNYQQITPDFIVTPDDDGDLDFTINGGNLPELCISDSFVELMQQYAQQKEKMNRRDKETLLYAKQKVEAARGFIDAIKKRRQTLIVTMAAILSIQKDFFREGDESMMHPMILKDVAEKTGLDISTISRVSNSKYVQTHWGTFPLKYFFSDGFTTKSGEEISTFEIKNALKDLIDKEDKKHPLSDQALTEELNKQGYPLARRTVAKYREQFGLSVARLRKQ